MKVELGVVEGIEALSLALRPMLSPHVQSEGAEEFWGSKSGKRDKTLFIYFSLTLSVSLLFSH